MFWLNKLSLIGLLLGLILVAARPTPAAEWKVGLASIKITPNVPVMMDGYSSRNRPYDKVETDLFAKALVLEDNAGHKGLLVTHDLVGMTSDVSEPICERIIQKTGLKREQIVLSFSHTHNGPTVSLTIGPSRNVPEGEAMRTIDYTRQLQDKVVDVAVQALAKMEPADLAYGFGVAHFVMNRRENMPDGRITLGANPRGLADRSVPVLQILGADGKPRAILFGASVHNTTLRPRNYELCGDYAGFAQIYLQEQFPGAQAMFVLGCAGDADPYPHSSMDLARQHGKSLADEVTRVLSTKLTAVRGPLAIAFARVDLPLDVSLSQEDLKKLAVNRRDFRSGAAGKMVAMIEKGEKPASHYNCPVSVWQFGQDLTLVALPEEVVVDYLKMIEKAIGPNQLWVAAYCSDVSGYVPSARLLSEGGYETHGLYYTGVGYFHPDVEKVLVSKVRELAIQAGRKLPE